MQTTIESLSQERQASGEEGRFRNMSKLNYYTRCTRHSFLTSRPFLQESDAQVTDIGQYQSYATSLSG